MKKMPNDVTAARRPEGTSSAKRPGPQASGTIPIETRGGPVTLLAWRHMLKKQVIRPVTITRSQYAGASEDKQRTYDVARKKYHRGISNIQTRQMILAHDRIDLRVEGNDGCAETARSGVVLSGMPLVGKSTIMLNWGRRFELDLREEYAVEWEARTSDGATFVPVIHVILGDGDGPKRLCQKIMNFFGEPYVDAWGEGRLTDHIHRLTTSCATRVLLIDQMQNLKMANRSAQQTAAHLKELMDVLPVTVIGAGVRMELTGFLTEGNAPAQQDIAQTGGRFSKHPINAYETDTPQGRRDWRDLIGTVGQRLVLLAHHGEDVPALSDYLFERTGGVTGDLMDLLRLGANRAIGTTERITRDVLDEVPLSARSAPATTVPALPDPIAAAFGNVYRAAARVR